MSTEFKTPQLPTFEEAEERVANGTASAMDRWLAENEVADPPPRKQGSFPPAYEGEWESNGLRR